MEKVTKKTKKKLSKKAILLLILLFLMSIASFTLYYMSDLARIKSIKIVNNEFVSENYIRSILDFEINDSLITLFPKFKEKDLKKNKMFKDIKITIAKNNCVIVSIKENRIIGHFISADKTSFVLGDGTIIDFKAQYIDNLALIPLFVDIDLEKIKTIAIEFNKLSFDTLSRISEVHNLSFTYDNNMVKLVMDEGFYVCSSIKGLPYVDNYAEIIAFEDKAKNKCILIIEEYLKAVRIDCSEIESYMVQPEENKGE
ncbi:MAG: FtsQ-type POTRA domain-containing protein [Erysipelotrichia bacterium]|nr:FtsQ-type POTRA domain-containing protein [Erysipelotrichia bacterium]